MNARLFFLSFSVLWLDLGVAAQSANSHQGSSVNSIFTSNVHGLDPNSYATLPRDPRFVSPPNAQGESSSQRHSLKVLSKDGTTTNLSHGPCEQPAKVFSAREYSGPLKRFTAWFSRKPEMTTVPTRRANGNNICSLDAVEKFHLFFKSTVDPVTFIGAGASAGFSQWNNDDKEWGQGAEGFGKRYAAAFTDRASRNFFGKFFYPTIFRQDPRYFREGQGSTKSRFGHALAHSFVARRDSGGSMPNLSLWAGTTSTVALANLYHPDQDRGFTPAAQRVGISIGTNMGFDVLKEFWPEIVRKLNLPFRERQVVAAGATGKQ